MTRKNTTIGQNNDTGKDPVEMAKDIIEIKIRWNAEDQWYESGFEVNGAWEQGWCMNTFADADENDEIAIAAHQFGEMCDAIDVCNRQLGGFFGAKMLYPTGIDGEPAETFQQMNKAVAAYGKAIKSANSTGKSLFVAANRKMGEWNQDGVHDSAAESYDQLANLMEQSQENELKKAFANITRTANVCRRIRVAYSL